MARPSRVASDAFQDEVIVGKAFDRHLLGRLLGYARPYRVRTGIALVTILLVTLLGLVGPYIGKLAIDGPISSGAVHYRQTGELDRDALGSLGVLAGVFVGVTVVLAALRFAQVYLMAQVGQRVMFDLRMRLFSHLQKLPLAFYDRNPVGRLVTRITSDIEALNEVFASGVVTFIADVLVLIGIAAALLAMNFELALVTLSALPFLLAATFIFRQKARRFYREQRRHLSHLNAFTQESIQGMSVIQLYHRELENLRHFESINHRYLRAFLRTVLAYALYFPAVEVLSNLALVAIIWFGARMIVSGEVSYGDFYYFWIFLGRFFQPIRDMAERYNILQSAMAAAERVFKILDTEPGMARLEAPPGSESASVPIRASEDARAPRLRGKVEFRNVWFAYQDEEYVLRDINFTVNPGEVVAIVGATGSGKSTLINLMSRLYDVRQGSVEVDGVDVRAYDKRELRARIGIVLQDVFLFTRSIADNIRLGREDISDDAIAEAVRNVAADRMVGRLDAGYDHVLTERGGSLSVGEKQLLAFARVLAHDPDFLVLDEATAHVDTETEVLIQKALERVLAGRTSLVIAHRLSTIRRANRILVVHKGEIREQGSHEELIRRGGVYARLHELQYK